MDVCALRHFCPFYTAAQTRRSLAENPRGVLRVPYAFMSPPSCFRRPCVFVAQSTLLALSVLLLLYNSSVVLLLVLLYYCCLIYTWYYCWTVIPLPLLLYYRRATIYIYDTTIIYTTVRVLVELSPFCCNPENAWRYSVLRCVLPSSPSLSSCCQRAPYIRGRSM